MTEASELAARRLVRYSLSRRERSTMLPPVRPTTRSRSTQHTRARCGLGAPSASLLPAEATRSESDRTHPRRPAARPWRRVRSRGGTAFLRLTT